MADKPTEIATIAGSTIKLIIDHDIRSMSPAAESDISPKSNYSSEDNRSYEEDEFTKISLNGLVQKTLHDPDSDIGRQMRRCLLDGDPIPKRLIYTALKETLDHVDPSKPVLIVDRRLSFDAKSLMPEEKGTISTSTQTDGDHSPSRSETKMANGIAELGVTRDRHAPAHAGRTPAFLKNESGRDADARASCPVRVLKALKRALFPLDEPVRPTGENLEEEIDKSNVVIQYLKKMRGGQKRPPYERPLEALQSLVVSFVGMLMLTVIDFHVLTYTDYTLVIGSFGATAVLIFCAIKSPLAQPRNVLGGHALAAIIGAAFQLIMGQTYPWLAAALAVSVSIALMSLTHTVHPPAGATALIAIYSNDKIHKIGFLYVLTPVLSGAAILVLVAVLLNNLFPSRRYPVYWF